MNLTTQNLAKIKQRLNIPKDTTDETLINGLTDIYIHLGLPDRCYTEIIKDILAKHRIPIRHTRVRQPNDNAHIERFNRTMREESIGPYTARTLPEVTKNIQEYLIYYNYARIHTTLRMTPMQMLQRC